RRGRLRPGAKRRWRVEPLGTQPDAPGVGLGQGAGFIGGGHCGANLAGFAPNVWPEVKGFGAGSRGSCRLSSVQVLMRRCFDKALLIVEDLLPLSVHLDAADKVSSQRRKR